MTSRPWRSGWCGLDAQPWQHVRCLGSCEGTQCVCDCHGSASTAAQLSEVVERYDVAGLVAALADVAARAGVAPPAVRRMLSAGGQLLAEVEDGRS